MTNQVYCPKCNESNYSTDTSKIDLNTGKKVGIGSFIGGLVLVIIGLFFVIMGLSPIIYPDPRNPKWSGIGYLVFGFFLFSSGLSLVIRFLVRKRVKLSKFRCNNCGYQWNILEKIGDETALGLLINRLKDKNKDIRQNAAEALRYIADARSKEALIQALKDEDATVKAHAVYALGQIGSPDVLEFLVEVLQEEGFRKVALEAIASIVTPPPKVGFIKTIYIPAIRDTEREKLLVEPLIKVLNNEDESTEMRAIAAEVLGKLDDKRAIEALTQAKNDEKRHIRLVSKRLLKEIHEDTKEK